MRTIFFILAFAAAASAQLTVINTSSTDIQPAQMFYIEADLAIKPTSYANGGFQSYGYRTVYGLDKKTEVGVSVFYTRDGTTSPVEANFAIKRQLIASEKHGIASTAGLTAYVPLNKSAGSRTVTVGYVNISKTFDKLRGLRLTAGAYRAFNTGEDFGDKGGITLAFEQPLFRRVSVIGDWSSGKNRFGYSAAGLNFALTKRQNLTAAYNWGNSGAGNNFLSLFYSNSF